MQAIPLGRVTVPTAGTPVLFSSVMTAAQRAVVPPSGLVAKIEVWPDPASTAKVFVKCQPPGYAAPITLASLPVPTGSYPLPWSGHALPYQQFSLDAATNSDGAFVTLWLE